ncbi:Cytochrome P450 4c21 [Pseudolycoriella hygida]|uniref:aromatase n=1 Tax=Pseudolycoriella hygida TaxID=35572 RepID=A0A9Q0MP40_9DIPT|nr:Cytochrome P450 4c21 [Pseudolycoriella hygida]
MFVVLISIVVLCVCLYVHSFRSYRSWYELNIPYHKFNPRYPFCIERLYTILKLAITSAEERFKIINALCLQYSDMVKVWFGPQLVVFVNHPQRVQKVLRSPECTDKWDMFYRLIERENALTFRTASAKWKEHRKFFNFSYSLPALESYMNTFADVGDEFCEILYKKKAGSVFNIQEIVKKICFDMLCETSCDMKTKVMFDESTYEDIINAFEITEEAFNHKAEFPFLYPDTIFKLTKIRRDEKKAQQILDEFRNHIMETRRSKMRENESIDSGNYALIDHLVRNEEKFTSKEILDHILNFIGAYEILGNTMSHMLLLIAMHPEVQERLYESIQKSIKSDEDVRNSAIIKQIELLDLVVKEATRLMPGVPLVMRDVNNDFEIEPGLVIPKGVKLVVSFYALHRHRDVWGNDAEEFKPERFCEENASSRFLFSFLPFSGGIRICVGNKYSNMALKIITVQLLRKFKLRTTMKMDDFRLKSTISLKMCTEHWVSVEARE